MKWEAADGLWEFISNTATAVVAVPVDGAGTVHAATLVFFHSSEPLRFFFITDSRSEKCRLLAQRAVAGACVVGTQKGCAYTLPMHGIFRLVDPHEYAQQIEGYYEKRGNRSEDVLDPYKVFLMFEPTWARYTDLDNGWKQYQLELS